MTVFQKSGYTALVRISLRGAPDTVAMTNNVTRFAMDIGEVLSESDPAGAAAARGRAARTLPAIIGFDVGCGLGAARQVALGLWSLALPAGFALLAFTMGFAAEPRGGRPMSSNTYRKLIADYKRETPCYYSAGANSF